MPDSHSAEGNKKEGGHEENPRGQIYHQSQLYLVL